MNDLCITTIQEICCDATSVNKPDKVSFFYKSSFHKAFTQGRVHVDFSLNVKGIPIAYFGIWRYRVSFWLPKEVKEISDNNSFYLYKKGFLLALAEAEKFVHQKYQVTSVMTPPTDEVMLEKFKTFAEKKDGDSSVKG